MASEEPQKLLQQALKQGLVINGVEPRMFPDSGLGLVASVDHDIGSLLVSVPLECLKTAQTVPQDLRDLLDGLSVHGLLTVDLMLDDSELRRTWKEIFPSRSSFANTLPFWWDQSLQQLLPDAASKLLVNQQNKLSTDWAIVSAAMPTISKDDYIYFWFTVNTRTFYYNDSEDNLADPDECLALLPFVDLFNHASSGCAVTFSKEAYTFTTKQKISAGDEIFTSYGTHSNDFLLTEYGFILEHNEHDVLSLDCVLLNLFNNQQQEILKANSFWATYSLDINGICYRTEVAVRLLCMPQDMWEESLENGFDEDDSFRASVDKIVCKSLKKYSAITTKMLQKTTRVKPSYSAQKELLKRRWEQISSIINHVLLNLESDGNQS